MAARICPVPRCPLIIPDGVRYRDDCAKCMQRKEADAPWARKKRMQFYHTAKWQKLRRWKLGVNPVCEACEAALATEVDHIISATEDAPELWFDSENLQSLCASCHKQKTASTRRKG